MEKWRTRREWFICEHEAEGETGSPFTISTQYRFVANDEADKHLREEVYQDGELYTFSVRRPTLREVLF